jgi:hypothetical protein
MSASASLNIGNETVSNVTNSTVNESVFSVNNCTNIVNTLNQETVIVVNADVGTTQNVWNEAKLTITNTTIELDGEGQELNLGVKTSAKQKAKILADCSGMVAHSSDLTDAMMYSISTAGESMQFSEMMSAAQATQTTECASSGLLSLSCQVGINNSVVSNINNSITNIFKMSISNYMSSETRRNLLLKNITESRALVEQSAKNNAELSISGSLIKLSGKRNKINATAESSSTSESEIATSVKSSATALTSAITDIALSTTNDVSNSQTAISKAHATADGSTEVSSEGVSNRTLIALAAIAGIVSICTIGINAWTKAKVCANRRGNDKEKSEPEDLPVTEKDNASEVTKS